jgi:hypothetical protein
LLEKIDDVRLRLPPLTLTAPPCCHPQRHVRVRLALQAAGCVAGTERLACAVLLEKVEPDIVATTPLRLTAAEV